jgi:sugar (pentulose or hexulose) kinase
VAAGLKKRWEEVEEWLEPDEKIVPNVSLRQTYDSLFSIYLNLYEKHKEDFKTAAKI